MFEHGLDDNVIIPIVMNNHEGLGRWRLSSNYNNEYISDGLRQRDKFKNNLQDYDLHHHRKIKWNQDNYTHVVGKIQCLIIYVFMLVIFST